MQHLQRGASGRRRRRPYRGRRLRGEEREGEQEFGFLGSGFRFAKLAGFSDPERTRVRRFSGEIQGADAQNPRIDARSPIVLAAYAAESGRVERRDADLGRTRSRLSSRGNAGAPERRAEGTREEGNLLADWARPEAERAEVSSAVHQEDMVEVHICVATRRASAAKSDIRGARNAVENVGFRLWSL